MFFTQPLNQFYILSTVVWLVEEGALKWLKTKESMTDRWTCCSSKVVQVYSLLDYTETTVYVLYYYFDDNNTNVLTLYTADKYSHNILVCTVINKFIGVLS